MVEDTRKVTKTEFSVVSTMPSMSSVMPLVMPMRAKQVKPANKMLELPFHFLRNAPESKHRMFVSEQREASEEARLRKDVPNPGSVLEAPQSLVDH